MCLRYRSIAPCLVRPSSSIAGTARVAGDGASIPSIRPSTSVSAEGEGDKPSILRTTRLMAPVNFSQPDILPPSTPIKAKALWNSGLPKASATNSSRLRVPYTSPSCTRTASSKICSCLTSGKEGFAIATDVPAWVISCRIVCTFIPLEASM